MPRSLTDPLGRNAQVTETGGGLSRRNVTTYRDGLRQIVVASDLNGPDGALSQTTSYDQLGRVRQTSDAAGNLAQTRYFTPSGSVNGCAVASYQLVSNPYVSGSEPTMGLDADRVRPHRPGGRGPAFRGTAHLASMSLGFKHQQHWEINKLLFFEHHRRHG